MGRAFSLIELVLTLTIVGIIATIAVPRFLSAGEGSRLDAAESRIVSEFFAASDLARANGEAFAIQVDPSLDLLRIYKNSDRTRTGLVKTVKLADAPYEVAIVGSTIEDADGFLVVDGYGMFEANACLTIQVGGVSRLMDLCLPAPAAEALAAPGPMGSMSAGKAKDK